MSTMSRTALIAAATATAMLIGAAWLVTRQRARSSKGPARAAATSNDGKVSVATPLAVLIIYATETGTSRRLAETLAQQLFACAISGFHIAPTIVNASTLHDLSLLESNQTVVLITPTWTDGAPPPNFQTLHAALLDVVQDFRVDRSHLSHLRHAVFGLGSSAYDPAVFCRVARDVDRMLGELGSRALVDVGLGDDAVGDLERTFAVWSDSLVPLLCEDYVRGAAVKKEEEKQGCGSGEAACGSGKQVESLKILKSWEEMEPGLKKGKGGRKSRTAKKETVSIAEGDDLLMTEEDLLNDKLVESDYEDVFEDEDNEDVKKPARIMDLEDLGPQLKLARDEKLAAAAESTTVVRDMVTPLQRKTLTKEGYKIIGTHSAVKLCRWTKAQLRGRGGCYKHSFYGIQSYQCMEATPSLACANKCVFCWRHHKNPVGREWRWSIDDPHMIVSESIEKHRRMINEFKGTPGVHPDRLAEAYNVRHCALSLVGEPIMYPKISEFLRDLHERGISSFLVTNAQFPDRIKELDPVTQLYVSIDASTKETLKSIDRPLFKDFWERFLECLRALRERRQRTVYRLTLVKGHNMHEVDEYAELVRIGQPHLIEIKGVTYCGKSDASNLTMQNVPWHTEVRQFAQALCSKLSTATATVTATVDYDLACEHAHSCCILLARTDFKNPETGRWRTWIDYDRFNQCVRRYYDEGVQFGVEDYWADTPDWAVFGAAEEGFDPVDTRWRRKGADGKSSVDVPYQPSDSGCG